MPATAPRADVPAIGYERDPHHDHRWATLAVLALSQLMVVLDATIVNIALPSAQQALGFSTADSQWIVTAYALAFGSLLLVGGRLGDLFGRKYLFIGGLLGFAVASAVGGAAQSFGVLVAARAAQGVCGAMLAPAALGLLTVIFTEPGERAKAFGVFGAVAGGGAALGLLLGGILTEYLSWRWCLYVNLVIAVPLALASGRLLHHARREDAPPLDVPGTITATLGLLAIVYGFAKAHTDGWLSGPTLGLLGGGVALLAAFVAIERRAAHPLLPLRVVTDRWRGGSYLVIGISSIGMFAVFLFLTYYLQRTLGFSPIRTGFAFLPMTFAIVATATSATTLLVPRLGPRILMTAGMAMAAIGLVLLAQLTVDSTYALHVLVPLLVMGTGMGLIFAPAMATGTFGVDFADAGIASATINTVQQVGGSIGTAALSSLFASALTGYMTGRQGAGDPRRLAELANVHGYTTAFWYAAAIFGVGAVLAAAVVPRGVPEGMATGGPAALH